MFTKEEKAQILSALTTKMGEIKPCPLCGDNNWQLQDGLVRLVVQEKKTRLSLGGRNFPCIALICSNCGNTHLVNLISLGLRELIEKEKEPKVNKKKAE